MLDSLGVMFFVIGCLAVIVAVLVQKYVINKINGVGGPRIMLPMAALGGLVAVAGLIQAIFHIL